VDRDWWLGRWATTSKVVIQTLLPPVCSDFPRRHLLKDVPLQKKTAKSASADSLRGNRSRVQRLAAAIRPIGWMACPILATGSWCANPAVSAAGSSPLPKRGCSKHGSQFSGGIDRPPWHPAVGPPPAEPGRVTGEAGALSDQRAQPAGRDAKLGRHGAAPGPLHTRPKLRLKRLLSSPARLPAPSDRRVVSIAGRRDTRGPKRPCLRANHAPSG